jgi:hypothetical protein
MPFWAHAGIEQFAAGSYDVTVIASGGKKCVKCLIAVTCWRKARITINAAASEWLAAVIYLGRERWRATQLFETEASGTWRWARTRTQRVMLHRAEADDSCHRVTDVS